MQIHAKIGRNIKKTRESKGKTVTALAKEIGVGQPFLSSVESGRKKASLELLFKISEALETPMYHLTGDAPKTRKETEKEIIDLEDFLNEMNRDDVKLLFEGEEIPDTVAEDLKKQIDALIKIKRYEFKKKPPRI